MPESQSLLLMQFDHIFAYFLTIFSRKSFGKIGGKIEYRKKSIRENESLGKKCCQRRIRGIKIRASGDYYFVYSDV